MIKLAAMARDTLPLISDAYREAQRGLHAADPDYGEASVQFAPLLADALRQTDVTALLDYGAGKGRLAQRLRDLIAYPLKIHHYDPAIPEWSHTPKPCEFVACIDVLEHVEPDLVENVLDDLKRVTSRFGFFTIHTGPAEKILPDGRNAHLIQQPSRWWLPKLIHRFDLVDFHLLPNGFWVIVEQFDKDSQGDSIDLRHA